MSTETPKTETWYKAFYYQSHLSAKVVEVQVERWSESSVWIKGRRYARETEYEVYFPQRVNAIGLIRRTLKALAEKHEQQAKLYADAAAREDY